MKRWVSGLVLAAWLLPIGGADAATEAEVKSMGGLQSLKVVVETLGDSVKKLGLTQSAFQTITEAHLQQQYHIKLDNDSPEFVYVKCSAVGPYRGAVAYNLSVQFRQMVSLKRDANRQLVAATWEIEGTFMTTEHNFSQNVQKQLQEMLDKFGYDFLQANAK